MKLSAFSLTALLIATVADSAALKGTETANGKKGNPMGGLLASMLNGMIKTSQGAPAAQAPQPVVPKPVVAVAAPIVPDPVVVPSVPQPVVVPAAQQAAVVAATNVPAVTNDDALLDDISIATVRSGPPSEDLVEKYMDVPSLSAKHEAPSDELVAKYMSIEASDDADLDSDSYDSAWKNLEYPVSVEESLKSVNKVLKSVTPDAEKVFKKDLVNKLHPLRLKGSVAAELATMQTQLQRHNANIAKAMISQSAIAAKMASAEANQLAVQKAESSKLKRNLATAEKAENKLEETIAKKVKKWSAEKEKAASKIESLKSKAKELKTDTKLAQVNNKIIADKMEKQNAPLIQKLNKVKKDLQHVKAVHVNERSMLWKMIQAKNQADARIRTLKVIVRGKRQVVHRPAPAAPVKMVVAPAKVAPPARAAPAVVAAPVKVAPPARAAPAVVAPVRAAPAVVPALAKVAPPARAAPAVVAPPPVSAAPAVVAAPAKAAPPVQPAPAVGGPPPTDADIQENQELTAQVELVKKQVINADKNKKHDTMMLMKMIAAKNKADDTIQELTAQIKENRSPEFKKARALEKAKATANAMRLMMKINMRVR